MEVIGWVYALSSLVIAGLGAFFAAYLPSKIMTEGTAAGPFLASLLGGLVIIVIWIWFARRTRTEGGEDGMALIEFHRRVQQPPQKVKKGHR